MTRRISKFQWLIIFILILQPGSATITAVLEEIAFSDSGQNMGNEFSSDVALGDLDGDGDADAFVSNSASEQNQVWINQGGEQGGTAGIYQNSGQPLSNLTQRGLALGDLDGDTDLDAFLVRGTATDSYQVWINQGGQQSGNAGTFQQNSFTVNDNLGALVVLGDVDGDNDLDAYIPRIFDTDQLYLNDGSGQFINSGQNLEPGDSLGAGLADLDGDNDLDVFTAVNDGANTVWLNQGGLQGGTEGVFQDSGQTLAGGQSLNVALGDLDNDNDIDAFVVNAAENKVWLNQGGSQGGTPGTFQANGQLLGFSASTDVQLADLDGDNDLDAFVAEFGPNTVWVNQGGDQGGTLGQFMDSGLALGNETSSGVALADVDGDGDIDAFIANSGSTPNKLYLNNTSAQLPVNPVGWQIQTVATRGITGRNSALVLDSADQPHISFVEEQQQPGRNYAYLLYGRWDGIRWQQTTIDSGPDFGSETAIVLDTLDNPHILYTARGNDLELRHAYWDGTDWQINVLESSVSKDIAFDLDSNDRLHVIYIKNEVSNKELSYAIWDGITWQTEILAANQMAIYESLSMVLADNDQPHLSYFDDGANALIYMHNNGSIWLTQTVAAPPLFFSSLISISLDGNNSPHIAYTRSDSELLYAQWDGTSWQIQTILNAPSQSNLTGNISLALDSADNPHISYAYDANDTNVSLRHIYWDGGQWQNETLDNSGSAGFYNSIALDSQDRPHISYYKGGYGDLRYLHWGPNWEMRMVPDFGQLQAVDLQVADGRPTLSYHNTTSTLLNVSQWQSGWNIAPLVNNSNPIPDTSLVFTNSRQHISYQDADNLRLMYGVWNGTEWVLRVIDNQGDVGRYNQLVPLRNSDLWIGIAYWDATNSQIKLAIYDALNNTVTIYPNTLQPTLNAASGRLAAAALTDGDVGVTYWDDAGQALRFAVWDSNSEAWVLDEVVNNFSGRLSALKTDALDGYPVAAYYDEVNDAILLAYRDETGWQVETAVASAGTVTSLDLELGFQSRQHPRIVYTTASDSRFAYKENGIWRVEIITNSVIPSDAVALALDNRPYLAYPTQNTGLQYVFRTATMDVNTAVPNTQNATGRRNNPLTPCPAIVDFFLPAAANIRNFIPGTAPRTAEAAPLSDINIYENMAAMFAATTGGQHYIDLYLEHGTEMGKLGLADPQLLWDAAGTLQNFLPGLEALVTGNGANVIVTQQMVDDALDIWQRLAAAGSPALASVINAELAQTNNLQNFVGLTFDEWALAIGVNPPGGQIYLPVINN